MSSRTTILSAIFLALASTVSAGEIDFLIPASGAVSAANESRWETEVTFFNAGSDPVALSLYYHDGTGRIASSDLTLAPRATTALVDIVRTRFGKSESTGAIAIDVKNDALIERLAITSRTANVSASGEYGQNIPAVQPMDSLIQGTSAAITGPSNASTVRLNFGLFAFEASTVKWSLVRADGTLVKQLERSYTPGSQIQYNRGVTTLFESTPQNSDTIRVDILAGRVIVFGSAVHNTTNDPSYVPAGRIKERSTLEFLGVDLDEDGTIDVLARNGVLTEPVILATSIYPNYFNIVALEPSGKTITYSLVNPSFDTNLINPNTVQWSPGVNMKGKTGSLTVRATDGFQTADLIIPVIFY